MTEVNFSGQPMTQKAPLTIAYGLPGVDRHGTRGNRRTA